MNDVELDWKAREVLEAVVETGGEATTGEVKKYTGLEWNNSVLDRFEKLERAGLVEVGRVEDEEWEREIPAPRVARVTETGREMFEDGELGLEVEAGDEELTMDERVLRLEKQVGRMRDTYGQVKQRIVELEGEVEEHDEDLDELAEGLENVKRFIAENVEE